jgi:type VI secretion system Hcp family effector
MKNPAISLLLRIFIVPGMLLMAVPGALAGQTLFLTFFDQADGESVVKGKEKWVELDSFGFGIEAETSWTKGGGASVGKPSPGKLIIEKNLDTASNVIYGYISTGKPFAKVEFQAQKANGKGVPETYLTFTMEGVFVTSVQNKVGTDGIARETLSFVYRTIKMEYKPKDAKSGELGAPKTFTWDIPPGTASPSN